jgi:hypothetical protein
MTGVASDDHGVRLRGAEYRQTTDSKGVPLSRFSPPFVTCDEAVWRDIFRMLRGTGFPVKAALTARKAGRSDRRDSGRRKCRHPYSSGCHGLVVYSCAGESVRFKFEYDSQGELHGEAEEESHCDAGRQEGICVSGEARFLASALTFRLRNSIVSGRAGAAVAPVSRVCILAPAEQSLRLNSLRACAARYPP